MKLSQLYCHLVGKLYIWRVASCMLIKRSFSLGQVFVHKCTHYVTPREQEHRRGFFLKKARQYRHKDTEIRRFKRTLKKQNRRRKWNPSRRPLVHQHPASFLSRHWRPLKSTSKIFQVRVQYYIIFPNLNDVIYQQSYWLICCPQTAISFRCCHCGFE